MFVVPQEAVRDPHHFGRIVARFAQRRLARRAVLASGVGVTATLLGAAVAPRIRAQDATPGALPPVLAAYFAGWSAHDDGTQLAALFAADGTLEDVPSGTVYRGPEEIATYPAAFFAALPDLHFAEASGFVSGERAAAEWVLVGMYTGTFPGLAPGTGQPVELRGVDILNLRDGMIQHVSSYYDSYSFLVQVGVLPVAAGTPAP